MRAYNPDLPLVAFDTETELFGPGNMAPRVACFSFAWRDEGGIVTGIFDRKKGVRLLQEYLEGAIAGQCVIAGHNAPYDVAVSSREDPKLLNLFFDAYEAGGVHCTMAAEWINDTAVGLLRAEWNDDKQEYSTKKSYGLENLARIHLGQLPYKDEWRMRYGELRDVPLDQWPERAREYPQQDAEFTLRIAEKQREFAGRVTPHNPLKASLAHVCRTYLALHLVSVWGEEIDSERVFDLERCMDAYSESFVPDLEAAGLVHRVLRGKKAGTLTKKKAPLQALIAHALVASGSLKESAPADLDPYELMRSPVDYLEEDNLTDGGKSGNRQIKCAADVLKTLAAFEYEDEGMAALIKTQAGFLESEKLRTSFAKPLRAFGNGPTHSRYNFAETGRTTCSGGGKKNRTGLNTQQMPRSMPKGLLALMHRMLGYEIDVRSCFVPRPGWVQSSSDFSALEMVTLAQSCRWLLGHSTLGNALNNGLDPHALFAADLIHDSYENVLARVKAGDKLAKDARQRSKVGNFGFPGGMGAKKFLKYARAQGVVLSYAESKALHTLYRKRWDEMPDYFKLIADEIERGGGSTTMIGLASGMIRGNCLYTDACNGNFQELAAFGATGALWKIVRECYDDRLNTALFGSRVVAFIHDEYRAEHPEEAAHDAATRLADIAREHMQEVCPDVLVKIEPALSRRWYKGVETVRDEHGRLQCWEPK